MYGIDLKLFVFASLFVLLYFVLLFVLALAFKNYGSECDGITSLPTYKRFDRKARRILNRSHGKKFMILSLNVDNFRFINDTCGIVSGNTVLHKLGEHFQSLCGKGELVCRYCADDFVFFLRDAAFRMELENRVADFTDVKTVLQGFLPPKYNITFSASVYHIDNPALEIEAMIDKASLARKMGRMGFKAHNVMEYTKKMEEAHEWEREAQLSMEQAFENMEFEVYYQPKFRFDDESVIGAEALIRWNNPRKGFLQPASFVPLFEGNGFIQKIDKFVLDKVCAFLEDWSHISKQKLTISFNLSRCHLYNPNLIGELKDIARRYDIGDNTIEVELTERIMIDNEQRMMHVMREIKNAGFSVSVDDFGAGYSSLNVLKDIPADVIKLDKEFLSPQNEYKKNPKERIIISSVVDMAKRLNIMTVAEGVETKDQSDMLKDIGCDIAQGFYFAKPMHERYFKAFLDAERKAV